MGGIAEAGHEAAEGLPEASPLGKGGGLTSYPPNKPFSASMDDLDTVSQIAPQTMAAATRKRSVAGPMPDAV